MKQGGWRAQAMIAAGLLVAPAAALGQGVPGLPAVGPDLIGAEQRRRLDALSRPSEPAPDARVEPPALTAPTQTEAGALRFRLIRVAFDPSAYLADGDLSALAAPLLGREVGLADLRALVAKVNALYASRGVVTAQALLPPQRIENGAVRIALVEGKVGRVTVTGAARGAVDGIRRAVPGAGALADASTLERRLKRYNAGHDAQLSARLAQGVMVGTTDVEIVATEPQRLSFETFADNGGFAATGRLEGGGVARMSRVLTGTDRLVVSGIGSRGTLSGSVEWSLPLLPDIRAALSLTRGRTRFSSDAVGGVRVIGDSLGLGGSAAALLAVTRRSVWSLTASGNWIRSTTDVAGVRVLATSLLRADAGLALSRMTRGLMLNAQVVGTLAQARETVSGTRRTVALVTGALGTSKEFGRTGLFLRGRAEGQWSNAANLPGLLQYQIGGSRTARSADPGVAAGDSGFAGSLEAGYHGANRRGSIELYALFDEAATFAAGKETAVGAAGLGLNAGLGNRLTLRATVAATVGGPIAANRHRAYVALSYQL